MFEAEFGRAAAGEALERSLAASPLEEEKAARARMLVAGVDRHLGELDEVIATTADRLPLALVALVDRTALRLALYELLFDEGAVRPNTAVRHAVTLAKRFGDDGSRRFVSGVLGTVVRTRLGAAASPEAGSAGNAGTE